MTSNLFAQFGESSYLHLRRLYRIDTAPTPSTLTARPVSYTHLDVYKRQSPTLPGLSEMMLSGEGWLKVPSIDEFVRSLLTLKLFTRASTSVYSPPPRRHKGPRVLLDEPP